MYIYTEIYALKVCELGWSLEDDKQVYLPVRLYVNRVLYTLL